MQRRDTGDGPVGRRLVLIDGSLSPWPSRHVSLLGSGLRRRRSTLLPHHDRRNRTSSPRSTRRTARCAAVSRGGSPRRSVRCWPSRAASSSSWSAPSWPAGVRCPRPRRSRTLLARSSSGSSARRPSPSFASAYSGTRRYSLVRRDDRRGRPRRLLPLAVLVVAGPCTGSPSAEPSRWAPGSRRRRRSSSLVRVGVLRVDPADGRARDRLRRRAAGRRINAHVLRRDMAPVVVTARLPGRPATAATLSRHEAMLARLPLFLFFPAQAFLLPPLARAAEERDLRPASPPPPMGARPGRGRGRSHDARPGPASTVSSILLAAPVELSWATSRPWPSAPALMIVAQVLRRRSWRSAGTVRRRSRGCSGAAVFLGPLPGARRSRATRRDGAGRRSCSRGRGDGHGAPATSRVPRGADAPAAHCGRGRRRVPRFRHARGHEPAVRDRRRPPNDGCGCARSRRPRHPRPRSACRSVSRRCYAPRAPRCCASGSSTTPASRSPMHARSPPVSAPFSRSAPNGRGVLEPCVAARCSSSVTELGVFDHGASFERAGLRRRSQKLLGLLCVAESSRACTRSPGRHLRPVLVDLLAGAISARSRPSSSGRRTELRTPSSRSR